MSAPGPRPGPRPGPPPGAEPHELTGAAASSAYYRAVAAYFDEDAAEYEERHWANPVIPPMRQAFREAVLRLPWTRALEVGCGIGLDLVHFARLHPERELEGIDVAPKMLEVARARVAAAGVRNARVHRASVDDAPALFGPEAFDLAYVFFGALNTVEDLERSAARLYETLRPGGHLVATFVNRWYVADILIALARGRWRTAFDRPRDRWRGYSPRRALESRCRSPREVRRALGREGELIARRGFSILYPAWYRAHLLGRLGRLGPLLWDLDAWLARTPAWSLGEYALYVFRKRGLGRARDAARSAGRAERATDP